MTLMPTIYKFIVEVIEIYLKHNFLIGTYANKHEVHFTKANYKLDC
mgnify:FL=1